MTLLLFILKGNYILLWAALLGEAILIVQLPMACCEMVAKTNDSWPI